MQNETIMEAPTGPRSTLVLWELVWTEGEGREVEPGGPVCLGLLRLLPVKTPVRLSCTELSRKEKAGPPTWMLYTEGAAGLTWPSG